MSTRYTNQQVNDQQKRFNSFMQTANLFKIGKTLVEKMSNEDHSHLSYTMKVLALHAKVSGSMYKPDSNMFYSTILRYEAVKLYIDTVNSRILDPLLSI